MSFLRLRLLTVLALCVAGLALAPLAAAQQPAPPPTPVVLIVDLPQVLRDAKAGKEVQSTVNQQYSGYAKEVAQQEDELQKGRGELERQRTVLAPDVYNTRARELQQRYDELSKVVQTRQQALQQSYKEAMTKVENAALEVIADLVKERKANLVMAKQALVFEDESMDITTETIARLDKKLPSVPVNPPKPETAAAAPKPPNSSGAPAKK
jgi:Skp family chaperone for outer membrane proteins